MHWEPVALEQLSSSGSRSAEDRPHVWWWPDHLHPAIASRRLRTDAILRTVLAMYAATAPGDLQFGREAHGRPFLLHPGAPDFNLSDTAGGTVVAVAAHGRVGIDIERRDRRPPFARLAARWFSHEEADALRQLEPEPARRAFLQLWTAKEASCKATGTGIFGFLSAWRFAVDDAAGDPAPRLEQLPADAGDHPRWRFHRLAPIASHTVALACRDLAGEPRGFSIVP